MLFGVGVDIVEVDRVRGAVARRGDRLLRRLYTQAELDYCLAAREPERARRLAARFAAKEAVRKAIGAGRLQAGWDDAEIVRNEDGCPGVRLRGRLAALAGTKGIGTVLVSLSHAGDYAMAEALALTLTDETGVDHP
ncbi:MAG TPA: holo-ACP synthase [Bacillota bacterium]|jgi:holo-[acyl-carrier protein] synthase